MTMPEPSPFARGAPDLIDKGFSVIPCVPHDWSGRGRGKAPGRYHAGHWSTAEGWQRFRDERLCGFPLTLAMKADGGNLALVMGSRAGVGPDGAPMFVCAIDVDSDDPDAVDSILSAVPHSAMRAVGRKGVKIFLRAPDTIRSRSFDDHRIPQGSGQSRRLVDLLTGFAAKVAVVAPSIHPDTGAEYKWEGTGPVRADELPIFAEDALQKLVETLQTLGYDPEGDRSGRGERKRYLPCEQSETSGDAFDVAKRAALSNIGVWVHGVDNLYGLRPARGGFVAVSLMRDSSSGQPTERRKRNLSIQTNGIRDFGTDETFSAIDLVAHHNGLTISEALIWLQEKLGIEDDGGVFIDLIPTTANDESDLPEPLRGLGDVPKSQTPPDIAGGDTEGARLLGGPSTAATGQVGVMHGAPAEIPAHLLQVPGLVGEITDWIVGSARRPNRAFALGTALLVIGTAAGRKIAGPTGSGTHLYVLGLADTGSGKDHALNAISTLLTAAGLERHIGKGEFMSHQAVYRDLMDEPLTLCPMDEFGSFLKKINNRNGSGSEKAITGVLRTAWGKSFATMPSPGWATKASAPIPSPALSLFGAATDRDFFTAIDGADLDNGFLNRFLLISTKVRPPSVEPVISRHTVPDAISDALVAIYNVANPLSRATMHSSGVSEPILTLGWSTPHVKQAFLDFENQVIDRATAEPMMARTSEMSIRLATIRALGVQGVKDPVVCMDDLEWAMAFAMWSSERLIADAKEHMSENQTEADRAKIKRLIRGAGQITQRDLTRKTNGFTARQVMEITRLLETAELVSIKPGPPAANGKKSQIYTWLGEQ